MGFPACQTSSKVSWSALRNIGADEGNKGTKSRLLYFNEGLETSRCNFPVSSAKTRSCIEKRAQLFGKKSSAIAESARSDSSDQPAFICAMNRALLFLASGEEGAG